MQLDRTTLIAGLKLKTVRDALREMSRFGDHGWNSSTLAEHLDISTTQAEWMNEALVEQDILRRQAPPHWDKDATPETYYALGELGQRFVLGHMLKRINRAKVDKIVADLLQRVEQINANPELCYFVNEIRLFGSAAKTDGDSFGDVDIAFDLGRRKHPPEYKDWNEWAHQRWQHADQRNLTFIQQLYWAQEEVLRMLKARNPYLSFHGFEDLFGIGAESKRLFILQGRIESDDGLFGEHLSQTRMAELELAAKPRHTSAKRRSSVRESLPDQTLPSPDQVRNRLITAARSKVKMTVATESTWLSSSGVKPITTDGTIGRNTAKPRPSIPPAYSPTSRSTPSAVSRTAIETTSIRMR